MVPRKDDSRPNSERTAPTIVWFRHDLRIADNAALSAAAKSGSVVPVFIWSPEEETPWPAGGAARVWLAKSLEALASELAKLGAQLIIRRGEVLANLRQLVRESGARAVYWNRRYEPRIVERDLRVQAALQQEGIAVESFAGALLFEPGQILNKSGEPFRVYTPFSRACLAQPEPAEPLPAPKKVSSIVRPLDSLTIESLRLAPKSSWPKEIRAAWQIGEQAGLARLRKFSQQPLADYATERDRPDHDGSSRLSPYLHWGEISPRQVWHAVEDHRRLPGRRSADKEKNSGAEVFVREILWREFAHHLLQAFPDSDRHPLQPRFIKFPWSDNAALLEPWQRGTTGYPLVDAGMRQLWATGWMHNRVRMLVASFLVKDLLIPWQRGAEWFWDTLVDADLANNSLGWQWTAGCGADAAPFFRIFNPVTQGQRFDPEGNYVREWVPELSSLPTQYVHAPWEAPETILATAKVRLGENYPHPIVDHGEARIRALDALKSISDD